MKASSSAAAASHPSLALNLLVVTVLLCGVVLMVIGRKGYSLVTT